MRSSAKFMKSQVTMPQGTTLKYGKLFPNPGPGFRHNETTLASEKELDQIDKNIYPYISILSN